MNIPLNIKCYMIVIRDNEASNYYASYCIDSWKNVGLNVEIFDAITPKDLSELKDINWSQYSLQRKYEILNLKVEITPTEKACFYSHYFLWKKSAQMNIPIMILEHDSLLEKPNNLWYDKECGIIFYDDASMGSYIIQPYFAKMLMHFIKKRVVGTGPYSIIERCAIVNNIKNLLINKSHPLFVAASNQVMSEKYQNTIEHFCNVRPELFNPKDFHRFIMI